MSLFQSFISKKCAQSECAGVIKHIDEIAGKSIS